MFSRSAIKKDESAANRVNFLIEGQNVTVKATATNSPSRLGLRMVEGEDLISIWFDWEHQAELQSVSERIGYKLQSSRDMGEDNSLPSIHDMGHDEILEFCESMNVHPAHLVPLKAAPEFSLPTPLLELLIAMSNVKDGFKAEDVKLAKAAVECERRRINSFLYDQSQVSKNSNGVTLTQVFSSVINNPASMARLAQEILDVHAVIPRDDTEKCPVAVRVKNLALANIDASVEVIKNRVKDKEALLNKALEYVEDEYSKIFNSSTSANKMLLFISEIKDALLDNQIEPREATISNINDALKRFDFTDSYLAQSYAYFNMAIGDASATQETLAEFLTDLAENVAVYFSTEDRLSKAKRRVEEEIDMLPISTDIEALFNAKNFQEGTLFRRLMDNHAIIAIDGHANSAHPTASPK